MLPKASVWLATMVCAPSVSPLGVNDHAPWALAVTVVAIGVPSMVKCTTVLARPVPLSASLAVIWSVADEPVSNVSASVTDRRRGAQRIGDGVADALVAGRIDHLGGQHVAAAVKGDALAPVAIALHDGGAGHRRAVEDRHGRTGVGDVDRAGDRLHRLVGCTARAGDRDRRSAGIQRHSQRCAGRAVARHIAELRRDRLAAVGSEVARRHRQRHAAGQHVGSRDGVATGCASDAPPSSS